MEYEESPSIGHKFHEEIKYQLDPPPLHTPLISPKGKYTKLNKPFLQ